MAAKTGTTDSTAASSTTSSEAAALKKVATVGDVFSRGVNGGAVVKSITMKRTLTRNIVSMAHTRELLCTFTSEPYKFKLAVAGRSDTMQDADVADIVNLETGEESMLVLNTVMLSAITRDGKPTSGRSFAFRQGSVRADKKYRVVDVVEVEVELNK